jgi:hypothetical protein
MTLSSNPNRISNLPGTRECAPMLAAAATAAKFKIGPEISNNAAAASAADVANASGRGVGMYQFDRYTGGQGVYSGLRRMRQRRN